MALSCPSGPLGCPWPGVLPTRRGVAREGYVARLFPYSDTTFWQTESQRVEQTFWQTYNANMEEQQKKKMGRPKQYNGEGAPRMTIRFDPDVLAWLKASDEGARDAIQGLVRQEIARTQGSKKASP